MKKKFIILIVIGVIGLAVAGYLLSVYLPKFVLKEKINIGVGGEVSLELIAENLTAPVDLFQMENDSRIFIADRTGQIRILENGEILSEPFLDISDNLVELQTFYEERGLLGIAFHPQYNSNGKFYVYYSAPLRESAPDSWDSTMRLSEFTVSQNADVANENSERVLLEIDKPALNHNGGTIAFGKDGYLYLSIGDGGNANDVGDGHNETIGNGQDTYSLLGKILRIDVNKKENGKEYGIPASNPFALDGGLKEIYAYGLRNPWRMSFDSMTGELYSGDAGQNYWEEINKIELGKNYGWNLHEGMHCFSKDDADNPPETCSSSGYRNEALINPVIEYKNAQQVGGLGHTTIGGFMYRGNELPELYGKFIFGDWSSSAIYADGTLFVAVPSESLWKMKEIRITNKEKGKLGEFILSFGRDADDELYLMTTSDNSIQPAKQNGKVYRITAVQ